MTIGGGTRRSPLRADQGAATIRFAAPHSDRMQTSSMAIDEVPTAPGAKTHLSTPLRFSTIIY